VHCTKVFAGKKPIRLPGDPSRIERYGAFNRGEATFHTRGGDLPLAVALARQLKADAENGRTAYANTVYLATISKGTVTKIKPVADIDENAVLQASFAGRALEGTIGVRTRQGDYAFFEPLVVVADKGDAEWDAKLREVIGAMRADGTISKFSEKWYGRDYSQMTVSTAK